MIKDDNINNNLKRHVNTNNNFKFSRWYFYKIMLLSVVSNYFFQFHKTQPSVELPSYILLHNTAIIAPTNMVSLLTAPKY